MSSSFDPIEAYRKMYLIRRVELEIVRRYYPDPSNLRESPMRCPVHLSIGQEGVAVGVAMAVGKGHAYSTHRCHAHYLAWGGNLDRMIAELYGKSTGCSGGRAGSMHLHDASVGFMGTSAIVGSSVSLAVGDAYAARLRGDDSHITVAFGGDAVLETGQFWESLNFAALHSLKLLFVIEDNYLSTATTREKRQAWLPAHAVTQNYDADDPQNVHQVVSDFLIRHQDSKLWRNPHVLRFHTRRFHEHVGMGRRPEYQEYPEDDPVKLAYENAADTMREQADAVLGDIEREVDWRIAEAFRLAEAADWPEAA